MKKMANKIKIKFQTINTTEKEKQDRDWWYENIKKKEKIINQTKYGDRVRKKIQKMSRNRARHGRYCKKMIDCQLLK